MDVKLVMFREDGSRRDFPVQTGVTTIGRKEDCGIRIPLQMISRRHAEIILDDEGITLKDLGAANGTYLNNRRVTEEELEAGDQIMIGPVIFTLQVDGDPPDEQLIPVRSKLKGHAAASTGSASVATSKHVYMSDDETDPISALEALASSADQTAINPEED